MPELDDDPRDEELLAQISFREWLGMKEDIRRLTHELAAAREALRTRPAADDECWHWGIDEYWRRYAKLRAALERIESCADDSFVMRDIAREALK